MTSALISAEKSLASGRTGATPAKCTPRRPYLSAVPDCEPPFDDERSAAGRLGQLQAVGRATALGISTSGAVGGRLSSPDVLVRGPDTITDAAVPGWSQDPDIGVRRTGTADLPSAHRAGSMLARALVEVLSGQRPVTQLRVHCAPDVFAGLQGRQILAGALGHLLSVRVCEPADGVAEISVVFRRSERVRALAFRVQGLDGRWRVTALQTG